MLSGFVSIPSRYRGLAMLIFIGIAGAVPQSSKPKPPDCFNYFPGTLQWNECFRRFSQDMANYQVQMQDHVQQESSKIEGGLGSTGESSTNTRMNPGNYYTGSSFLNSISTSNSFTGGYSIKAVNMQMSTSLLNNVVKVVLQPGPIDKFDTRTNGNEITLIVVSKGQRKWAQIIVPPSIKVSDVKIERSADSIYLVGPTPANLGGNFQISQSSDSSSSYGGGSFNQNFGQFHAGNIASMPPIPMPEFQNAFQNMFQNLFANMFGVGNAGRTYYSPRNSRYAEAEQGYTGQTGPLMWFY